MNSKERRRVKRLVDQIDARPIPPPPRMEKPMKANPRKSDRDALKHWMGVSNASHAGVTLQPYSYVLVPRERK